MRAFKYFLLSFLFLSSCDKFEWHNPYDPECPKELFTPSSPGAAMEGNSVKLTWSQQNDKISGFNVYRSTEGEPVTSLTQTQKSTTQYIDASITPGKKYTYYVLAVAGTNQSDTIKAEIIPVFPVTVSSSVISNIGSDSAFVDAEILNGGGGQVDDRGVCWSTMPNPTVINNKFSSGTGIGKFTSKLSGLQTGQTYYVRAYGQNSRGISYGNEATFTTLGLPKITATAISDITPVEATSGGNIESDGGSSVTARGICWSKSPDPTISNSKTNDGTGTGSFISKIISLEPGTLYYVRAYAQNSVGVSYSDQLSFTTLNAIPVLTTASISNLTSTTATSGGSISSDGGAPITARGVCWSTTTLPTINSSKTIDGTGTGIFISKMTSLEPGTLYYVRAYAQNSFGVSYGAQLTFTTSVAIPVLTTTGISNLTSTTATSGGSISSDGGAPITARGVCWSTTTLPTINNSKTIDGSGTGTYTSQVVGLKASTTYYLRAYASNSFTTVYGEQLTFTTPTGPLFTNGSGVTDVEGNSYKTVIIGTQEWMAENLKVTKLRDGTAIPNLIFISDWAGTNSPAYCNFFNEPAKGETYGKLYNYYTVVDNRSLCPVGWHVPTFDEFLLLENYLGASEAGKLMKSTIGWNFWSDPLQGNGNNLSGFNGLPGGRRGGIAEDFVDGQSIGYWWTTSEFSSSTATCIALSRENYIIGRVLHNKIVGISVRCIKN